MSDVPETLYLEIVLADAEDAYVRQLDSIDKIKTSIRSYLSAASLLLALGGAFQILTMPSNPFWLGWHRFGLGLVGVFYVALITLCAVALFPVSVGGPTALEWDEMTTAYKGLSKIDALRKRLISWLQIIELNKPAVTRMRRLGITIGILLPLQVVVLLLLAMIPRV